MCINRSGFYKWLERKRNPSQRSIDRAFALSLFTQYHDKYPSHGYRWLNAKIRLDLGLVYSDAYAHRCCKYLGIKSKARRVKRYGKSKTKKEMKNFPNVLLKEMDPKRPLEIVVSDMTAFYLGKIYYELTLFMDLYNNEIIAYSLSDRRGDPKTYHEGLQKVLKQKEEYKDLEMVLHTDQGSVYSSKKFNEALPQLNIIHSMSKTGKPYENGAMEAINGWIKEELFIDFNLQGYSNAHAGIEDYIHFFNYERPSYVLNYLTPMQYKDLFEDENETQSA